MKDIIKWIKTKFHIWLTRLTSSNLMKSTGHSERGCKLGLYPRKEILEDRCPEYLDEPLGWYIWNIFQSFRALYSMYPWRIDFSLYDAHLFQKAWFLQWLSSLVLSLSSASRHNCGEQGELQMKWSADIGVQTFPPVTRSQAWHMKCGGMTVHSLNAHE